MESSTPDDWSYHCNLLPFFVSKLCLNLPKKIKSTSVTETTVKYEVTFGPKKHSDREKCSFNDEQKASDFFHHKEKQGMYVDVYLIETTIATRKVKLTE